MQYIEFKVRHQTITRTDDYEVVGNSQNYLFARFEFCEEWADVNVTAVFSTNSGNHYSAAIRDGECLVPWEVLRCAEFWVGVFGGDRMTTSTVRVPVKPGVKFNASPGMQPSPTAYEKLVGIVTDNAKAAESAKNAAAESADNAERFAVASQESAAEATGRAEALKTYLDDVQNALDNLPNGSTLIINDLTTGGANAALSAEMGKELGKRVAAAERLPRLTDEQKKQLTNLVTAYHNNMSVFTYVNEPGRNIYKDNGCYNANGRVITNCSNYVQKLWAGVHPNTFKGKQDTYDGTLEKAFDWGCEFLFPNRQAHGLTNANTGALFNFVKPNEDNYEGSYSWNSYYGPKSEREDGQILKGYCFASDMAQEMYMRGFEVPMREVDVGDIIFFKAPHSDDNIADGMEEMAFRNIGHVGIVTNVSRISEGKIGFSHSMDYIGANTPFSYSTGWGTTNWDKVYNAFLTNNIVMIARHPAAFGVPSNLGDKFTVY